MTPRPDAHHEAAIEAACDLDRAYFAENPDQSRYIRPPIAHEACFTGYGCWDLVGCLIEVFQVVPGVRARAIVPAGARA